MHAQRAWSLFFLVLGWAALPSPAAHAQLEPEVTSYRFLPRLSVVHETGGFAGYDWRFRVRGEFDFKKQQSLIAVFPPQFVGSFENVDAWGVHPDRDYAVNIEEAFNLEEIEGATSLMKPRLPNLFYFRGEREDGSAINLHVLLRGPWLYMRGGTTPPPGSADFLEHHIRALARKKPGGDFNGDGEVDVADLRDWISRPGRTGDDFLNWQRNLGDAPTIDEFDAELNAALAVAASSIPEPGSLTLAGAAAVALLTTRRRRFSRH